MAIPPRHRPGRIAAGPDAASGARPSPAGGWARLAVAAWLGVLGGCSTAAPGAAGAGPDAASGDTLLVDAARQAPDAAQPEDGANPDAASPSDGAAIDAADGVDPADGAPSDLTPDGAPSDGAADAPADLDTAPGTDTAGADLTVQDVPPIADAAPPDALQDAAVSDLADSDLADSGDGGDGSPGPEWLGVCPPDPVTALGAPLAEAGFPVPGVACAKKGWPSAPKSQLPLWTDLTAAVGLGAMGPVDPCAVWQDLNGDGRPDLIVVERPVSAGGKRTLRYFEWTSSGGWTLNSTPLAGTAAIEDCNPVDFDGDGDVDLALATANGLRIILQGIGNMTEAPAGAIPAAAQGAPVTSSATADVDRDGDQDLYLTRAPPITPVPGQFSCYPADGPYLQCCYGANLYDQTCATSKQSAPMASYQCCNQFLPETANLLLRRGTAGMASAPLAGGCSDPWPTTTTAARDINRDGWPDLFAGNHFGPHGWYRIGADGTCAYHGTAAGLRPYGHSAGVAAADFNNDGLDDWAHGELAAVTVYQGLPGGGWVNGGAQPGTWDGLKDAAAGAQLAADFDNDGWVDLWSLSSLQAQPGKLAQALQTKDPAAALAPGFHAFFHNQGGKFAASQQPWPAGAAPTLAKVVIAAADMEGDGDLDVVYTSPTGQLRVLRNDTPASSHWLAVDLLPDVSATGGVGARVQVWAQGYVQEREISWSPGTGAHGTFTGHLGLGSVDKVDQVVVWWPSGRVSLLGPQAVDQLLLVKESQALVKSGSSGPAADAGSTGDGQGSDAVPLGPSGIQPMNLQAQQAVPFVEITASLGLVAGPTLKRRECAVGQDLDGDGRDDILLVESFPSASGKTAYQIRVVLNKVSGYTTKISKIDATMVVPAMGCSPMDITGDGRLDLVIGTVGSGMALYVNDGQGGFIDQSSFLLPEPMEFDTWAAAMGDLDLDGVPELIAGAGNNSGLCAGVVCGYLPNDFWCKYATPVAELPGNQDQVLMRKALGLPFTAAPVQWSLPKGGEVSIPLVLDLDRDGWQDLLISNDFGDHYLLHNQKGVLKRYDSAIGFAGYAHGMGWGVADFDQDGYEELVLADAGPLLFYQGKKPPPGQPVAYEQAAGPWGAAAATHDAVIWDPLVFDFDHDGREDLWLGTSAIAPLNGIAAIGMCQTPPKVVPQRDLMLRNNGSGGFETLVGPLPLDQETNFASTVQSALDIDADGDLDVVQVRRGGYVHVYRNDWAPPASAVSVQLQSKSANSVHIGAWMTASVGGKTQLRRILGTTGYGGTASFRAHFGLGSAKQIDELVVHWPDGKVSKHGPLAAGAKVTLAPP